MTIVQPVLKSLTHKRYGESMIFDTHTHYDDEAYDADREAVILRQRENGVGLIVACGADMESSNAALKLAEDHEYIYAAVGIHPDNIGQLISGRGLSEKDGSTEDTAATREIPEQDELAEGTAATREIPEQNRSTDEAVTEWLRAAALHPKCRAIGEIGLDYHWDVHPRQLQQVGFKAQWRLARELNLPVVIHSRDAAEDTLNIVREMYEEYRSSGTEFRADMHCYSYSAELAEEYIRMGMYFGIGGVLTFKNAKKLIASVGKIPMDRILLETDCPYLAPEPYRGSRNESSHLKGVVGKLAEIKGFSGEEIEKITYENARRFYGI